ncbi:MAG: hypothetical protein ACYDHU_09665 [Acidimicrobiales bacterium]
MSTATSGVPPAAFASSTRRVACNRTCSAHGSRDVHEAARLAIAMASRSTASASGQLPVERLDNNPAVGHAVMHQRSPGANT